MDLIARLEFGSLIEIVNQYDLEDNSGTSGVMFWVNIVDNKICLFKVMRSR